MALRCCDLPSRDIGDQEGDSLMEMRGGRAWGFGLCYCIDRELTVRGTEDSKSLADILGMSYGLGGYALMAMVKSNWR